MGCQCRDFKWIKKCPVSLQPSQLEHPEWLRCSCLFFVCMHWAPRHATITPSHGHYAISGTSVHTWNSWRSGVMLPLQYCSWAVSLWLQKTSCCIWASHSFGFELLWVSLFHCLLLWFSDVPWLLSKSSIQQIQNQLSTCLCCYKEVSEGGKGKKKKNCVSLMYILCSLFCQSLLTKIRRWRVYNLLFFTGTCTHLPLL